MRRRRRLRESEGKDKEASERRISKGGINKRKKLRGRNRSEGKLYVKKRRRRRRKQIRK